MEGIKTRRTNRWGLASSEETKPLSQWDKELLNQFVVMVERRGTLRFKVFYIPCALCKNKLISPCLSFIATIGTAGFCVEPRQKNGRWGRSSERGISDSPCRSSSFIQKWQLPLSLDLYSSHTTAGVSVPSTRMAEKQVDYTLLSQGEERRPPVRKHTQWNRRVWQLTIVGILIVAAIFTIGIKQTAGGEDDRFPTSSHPACPQYPASKSSSDAKRKLEKEIKDELNSDAFWGKSLKKLQGAINVPTESFDDMGKVGEDPRWDIFADFHAYLREAFPLV